MRKAPPYVLIAAFVALASGSAAVAARQAGPQPQPTQMVLKEKAPVSKEILKVKLPKPQEADLANGLHVMVLEDHEVPQVTFQMIIPGAGGYYDPEDKIGLASYTASLMREGTKTRTSPQISEALETMAAGLSVSSGLSGTTASIVGSALREDFDRLLDLAADVLLNPAFSAEEWNRFKVRTKTSLIQQRTQPTFLAMERFNRVIYGAHPASRVSPTAEHLDAITPAALADFHKAHYVPDHAIIAFAGDITLADARKVVEGKLGAWKNAGTQKITVTDPPDAPPAKVYLIARPNSVQTTLYVGTQSMTRTDPDYPVLTVVNRVLGGTMGRLFRHLREEKGYTYGIGSGFSASLYRGAWTSSTNVRTDVTEPALDDLLAEIAGLRDTPVSDKELADTKRAIVGSFALALENPQQVLSYYIDSWMYGLPADYWDTYPAKIAAVTAEQAQQAARKYWDPARLQIVAVGDATKIREILAKKGTLEVYDSEGKPITDSSSRVLSFRSPSLQPRLHRTQYAFHRVPAAALDDRADHRAHDSRQRPRTHAVDGQHVKARPAVVERERQSEARVEVVRRVELLRRDDAGPLYVRHGRIEDQVGHARHRPVDVVLAPIENVLDAVEPHLRELLHVGEELWTDRLEVLRVVVQD
jgi:predicted Zn-dependent peptidase